MSLDYQSFTDDDHGGGSWQTQTAETAAASSRVHVYRRQAAPGPLRKLSVDLIHTYKHINEVCGSSFWPSSETCYRYIGCILFSNVDRSRLIRANHHSAFIIKSRSALTHLRKLWLSHAHLCCRRSLFTVKSGRGLWRSAQTRTRWPCPLRPERSVCSFSPDWIDLIWQI